MRVEVKTRERGSPRSPSYVFRKWVIIGAVVGAVIVGLAGAMILGATMVVGALFGAVIGAVFGVFKAAMAAIRR